MPNLKENLIYPGLRKLKVIGNQINIVLIILQLRFYGVAVIMKTQVKSQVAIFQVMPKVLVVKTRMPKVLVVKTQMPKVRRDHFLEEGVENLN
jgi:hypothetical protein